MHCFASVCHSTKITGPKLSDLRLSLHPNSLDQNSRVASNSIMAIANCNSGVKSTSHVTGRCAFFNIKLHFLVRLCYLLYLQACSEVKVKGRSQNRALEEGVRDSKFRAYYRPGIQDSNFKQGWIQDSKLINMHRALCGHRRAGPRILGFRIQSKNIQDSEFKFETGLDSAFKFESQKNARDSGFRFGLRGPSNSKL